MARDGFARALDHVLRHEGGYVDHPADPGGATNHGITRATLAAWRGRPVSKAEVMALTRREAAAIYRARYWDAVAGDRLPAGLDLAMMDLAVNSGPARAARLLRAVLGLPAGERIDDGVIAAAAVRDPAAVIRALTRRRRAFLEGLATWRIFGRGWSRRIADTERVALERAARPSPSAPIGAQPEETTMPHMKSIWQSRTIWANLVGLGALALGALGVDVSGVDQPRLVEALAQGVAAASFIASTIFRIVATRRLVAGR